MEYGSYSGYISLYRKLLLDADYFTCSFDPIRCWIDILLMVKWNEEESQKRGIKVVQKRGQWAVSIRELSVRWKLSPNTVIKRLADMQKQGKIDTQKSQVTTLISVVNWDKYQNRDTQNDTLLDTQNDTHADTQNDTLYINKNKENKINKTPTELKNAPTHTREVLPAFQHYSNRNEYIKAMLEDADHWNRFNAADGFWKGKGLTPMLLSKAFLQYLTTEKPNNTWSSLQDFEKHFVNWIKYQQWDDIVELTGKYDAIQQEAKWRKMQEQRKAQEEAEWERHKAESCPMPEEMANRLFKNRNELITQS